VRDDPVAWIMSAMVTTPTAFVLAGLLAVPMIVLAVALFRFTELIKPLAQAIAQFAQSMAGFRVIHAGHRDALHDHAKAIREQAAAQPPMAVLESIELDATGCGTGCCQGPLPEAVSPTMESPQPLVAPSMLISDEDIAASARRRTSRNRVNPESVTPAAEGH
jgi:hypothetical protein